MFAYGDPFKTTASQKSVEALHENGYFVYPGKFALDDTTAVLLDVIQIANTKWRGIFNPNKKRFQCVELNLNYACMKKCVDFMKTVNPELQSRQWAVLRTEEGALRQHSHADYNPRNTKSLPNN